MSESARIVEDYYTAHYASVHGAGCLGGAARLLHQRLERRRGTTDLFPVTVEVGAGRFEHYPSVRHARDLYLATDIRTPASTAYAGPAEGVEDPQFIQMDALELALGDHVVDRLVASCLLIHLPDPMAAVTEWQRVVKKDGVIDMLVPCDPGLASRTFRRVVSRRTARAQGVPAGTYELVNAIEHLSPFSRVLTMTRAAIEPDRRLSVEYFPFGLLRSWNLNAFAVFSIEPR